MTTDTPTYEQLSALCAQMAAELVEAKKDLIKEFKRSMHDADARHHTSCQRIDAALAAVGEKNEAGNCAEPVVSFGRGK